VKRLIHAIVLSWGWRRRLIAFALGAVSALAMAPFDAWPILFLTVPALVWLIDGAGVGRLGGVAAAAATGWWFGFGYFLAGLYWIGYAFLVDAPTFGWLLPVAVIGLPAVLAIYMALGAALARMLWMRGTPRIFALGVALTASEWLRGHLFTGFPWNAFGYALTAPLPLAQAVSVFGIWGYTFIAIVVFASPATLTDDPAETRRPWLPLTLAVAVLVALGGFGAWRLERTPTRLVDGVHLRIMQPNLQQDVRFNYAARHEVMSRYLALSSRASAPQPQGDQSQGSPAQGSSAQVSPVQGVGDTTQLIWPESPFPFFLTREADALGQIANLLTPNAVLITGAMRLADPDNPAQSGVYNSIYVIDHTGSIAAVYDKVHLVPFGEYLPFEQILERIGLQELTEQRGGFLAGDRHRLIAVPGAPEALPLICYEIVFAAEVRPHGKRPGWIVNVTNDGWFGISTGPYQHFQQARVTAIELGLPLVRAANTGISGVVDPVGRIINALPLGSEGVLDSSLPRAIGATFYARFGDAPAGIMVGIVLFAVVRRRVRADIQKT
jgi:apolipoprotein N-acyltransferase